MIMVDYVLVQTKPNAAPVAGSGGGGGTFPTGVYQAIDGETMGSDTDPTMMTHSYYGRNGFTAATATGFNGLSWDGTNFIPRCNTYAFYEGATQLANNQTMGICASVNLTSEVTAAYMQSATWNNNTTVVTGVWEMKGGLGPTGGSPSPSFYGACTVANHIDENNPASGISNSSYTNADQAGRFWDCVGTWINQMVGGNWPNTSPGTPGQVLWGTGASAGQGMQFTMPSGGTRTIDTFGCDIYWFESAGSSNGDVQYAATSILYGYTNGGIQFISSGPAPTADEMARGSHYGQMIDVYRAWANGQNVTNGPFGGNAAGTYGANGLTVGGTSGATSRIPLCSWIETNQGQSGSASPQPITAAQLHWAIWSSLIHGCRILQFFVYSIADQFAGEGPQPDRIAQLGIDAAWMDTLAPILLSPSPIGYIAAVSDTGGGGGYIFPVVEPNWLNGGIECCAHWYPGGSYTPSSGPLSGVNLTSGAYIFATTRYGEAATMPITATFTINDNTLSKATNPTGINVVGEDRSLALIYVSGNSFTFADEFAAASTVHIYQVVR
jgi:hypothetical protein